MNLLISDQLTCPPTWPPSFRDLTLYCSRDLCDAILVEADAPDPVFRWLKSLRYLDFIDEIVNRGSEEGLRLDTGLTHSVSNVGRGRTVLVDKIDPSTFYYLVAQIQRSNEASRKEKQESFRRGLAGCGYAEVSPGIIRRSRRLS